MNIHRAAIVLVIMLGMSSMFGTARGQRIFDTDLKGSSIFLEKTGGLARYNFTDKSVTLGYLKQTDNVDHPVRLGLEASTKLQDGKGSLFSGGQVTPEGQVSFLYGQGQVFRPPTGSGEGFDPLDWLGLQLSYRRAQYKTITATAADTTKTNFDGVGVSLVYNAQPTSNFLWGASLGWQQGSNIDKLKKIEVCTEQNLPTTDGTQRVIEDCTEARLGDYKEVENLPFAADFIWFPPGQEGRFAFDFFTRLDLKRGGDGAQPGIAILFTDQDTPTRIKGGVAATVKDGKVNVSIFSGFNF